MTHSTDILRQPPSRRALAGWRRLTLAQHVLIVLATTVLLFEAITLAVETRAISERVAERARTTTLDFASSVFPLLLSRSGTERTQIAADLGSNRRQLRIDDQPVVEGEILWDHHDTARMTLSNSGIGVADLILSEQWEDDPSLRLRSVSLTVRLENEDTWLTAQTQSPVAEIRRPLLLAAALESAVALVVLTFVLVVVGRMMRPLGMLARNAEQLSYGERPDDVPPAAGRDLQVAIRSFNQMSRILAQSIAYQRGLLMSLGHDMKGPLDDARKEVLAQDEDPSKARILRALDKAQFVAGLVTEYTRATMRDGSVEIIELSSLLEALVEDAQERGRDVQSNPMPGARVRAHYNALTRAISNLVENGAKYGGTVHVRLSLTPDKAVVEIRDSGPGIPEDMLDEVTLPFRRLAGDREGTGLGLAIAKTIVIDNGGTLTLENHAKGGLLARIEFPLYGSGGSGRNT